MFEYLIYGYILEMTTGLLYSSYSQLLDNRNGRFRVSDGHQYRTVLERTINAIAIGLMTCVTCFTIYQLINNFISYQAICGLAILIRVLVDIRTHLVMFRAMNRDVNGTRRHGLPINYEEICFLTRRLLLPANRWEVFAKLFEVLCFYFGGPAALLMVNRREHFALHSKYDRSGEKRHNGKWPTVYQPIYSADYSDQKFVHTIDHSAIEALGSLIDELDLSKIKPTLGRLDPDDVLTYIEKLDHPTNAGHQSDSLFQQFEVFKSDYMHQETGSFVQVQTVRAAGVPEKKPKMTYNFMQQYELTGTQCPWGLTHYPSDPMLAISIECGNRYIAEKSDLVYALRKGTHAKCPTTNDSMIKSYVYSPMHALKPVIDMVQDKIDRYYQARSPKDQPSRNGHGFSFSCTPPGFCAIV